MTCDECEIDFGRPRRKCGCGKMLCSWCYRRAHHLLERARRTMEKVKRIALKKAAEEMMR